MTTPTPKVPLPEPDGPERWPLHDQAIAAGCEFEPGSDGGREEPPTSALYVFTDQQLETFAELLARRGGGSGEWFPLLGTPLALRWSMLDEASAQRAHGQSLARLAERGGLSPAEAAAVVEKRAFRSMDARGAFDALLAAAPPSPEGAEEYVLPCDVMVAPATIIRKGCKLSTLMRALSVRERSDWEWGEADLRITRNPTPPPPVAHGGEVTEAMVTAAIHGFRAGGPPGPSYFVDPKQMRAALLAALRSQS